MNRNVVRGSCIDQLSSPMNFFVSRTLLHFSKRITVIAPNAIPKPVERVPQSLVAVVFLQVHSSKPPE